MNQANYARKLWAVMAILFVMAGLCGCSNMEKALHISYTDAKEDSAESVYAKGNYIYNTVTISGADMGSERILSIKEMEEMALSDETLGYQGTYSFLTRGAVFSSHEITGIGLYELLLSQGMDEGLSDDTKVTLVAAAAVLTMEPDILVMDEPLSHIDEAGRGKVLRLIKRLRQAGKTTLSRVIMGILKPESGGYCWRGRI